jgi:multiple sugar transport system permease protein
MLTFPIWLYVKGFANFQLGYACAMAVMLFVVSLAFTAVLLRRSRVFLYGAEGA